MEYENIEELIEDVKRSALAQAGAVINFIINESVNKDPYVTLKKIRHCCGVFIENCPESAQECCSRMRKDLDEIILNDRIE